MRRKCASGFVAGFTGAQEAQPGSHGDLPGHCGRSLSRQGHTGRGLDENDEQHCIP